MKAAVFRARHGTIEVEDIPPPLLTPGSLLIANSFSVISAGTERARLETGEQSLIGKGRLRAVCEQGDSANIAEALHEVDVDLREFGQRMLEFPRSGYSWSGQADALLDPRRWLDFAPR